MKEHTILCWNVNGIRAMKKKGFLDWLRQESPDIMCCQETKVQADQLDEELASPEGYRSYWNHAGTKGYSGVVTYYREEPLSVSYGFDDADIPIEGRVLITEHPHFTLFNIYFPNGKGDQERLDYKLRFYDVFLDFADGIRKKGKKLVICGDVNTAHKEIDIARPKANENISGFLPEERAWIDKFISHGYVDTFRQFNQEPGQYTWWDLKSGARARNVGWRLDYFFVSEDLLPAVKSSFIMSGVMGSDHCPVGIVLKTD
jgi:exodeoxyribonuclease-3